MSTRFVSYPISSVLLGQLACSQQQRTDQAEAAARLPVTVGVIEQSLREIGGKATLAKYICTWSSGNEDFTVMDNISTGSREWVDLAVKMRPFSDAGCTWYLTSALGDAMQKQPRNVLPYVGQSPGLSPDQICMPFISNEIPDADALRQVRTSKAAIQSVTDAAFSKQCAACLQRIESLENKILADMARRDKK